MNIKIFKFKKNFRKGGLHTNQDIYWNILQALAFLFVVSSFVLGFYLFRIMDREFSLSPEDAGGQSQAISKERINNVLNYFVEKEIKSKSIINSPALIVDPSR